MASITSVISLFVLLLVTYCYSVPIKPQSGSPKPIDEFTTGKTIVDNEDRITMRLLSDEESTGVPNIHKPRKFSEHSSEEHTTVDPLGLHSPRGFNEHYNPHRPHSSRGFNEHSSEELTTVGQSGSHSPRKLNEHSSEELTTVGQSGFHSPRKLNEHSSEELTTVGQSGFHSPRKFNEHSSEELTTVGESGSHSPRTLKEHDSEEATTSGKNEQVARPSRISEDSSSPKALRFVPSLCGKNEQLCSGGESLATMDLSAQFNQRAMKISGDHSEELSTVSPRDFIENERDFELTTNVGQSFSSSADSFGKMTGLLNNGQSKGLTESTTNNPDQNQQIIEKEKSNN
jgi:hypothetical protein